MFGRKMRSGDYLPYSREGSYPYVAPRPLRYGSYPVVYSDQYPFMVEDPAYPIDYPSGYYGTPYSMESRRRYHPHFVRAAPANCRGQAPWEDPALDGGYYPRERVIDCLPNHEFAYPLRRAPSVKASQIPAEEAAFRSPYYTAHSEPQRRYATPQFVLMEDVLRDALQNQGKAQDIEKRSSTGQYVLLDDALRKALQSPQPARGTEDGDLREKSDRPVILVPSNYLRNDEDAKILPPKNDPATIADNSSNEGRSAYVPLKIPVNFSPFKEDNVANVQRQAEPIYILGPDSLIPAHLNSSHGKSDDRAEGSKSELGYPIAYIPASSLSNFLNQNINTKQSKPSAAQITDTSQPKPNVRLVPVTQQADYFEPVYFHVGRPKEADFEVKDGDRNTRTSINKDQLKHAPPGEGQPDMPKQFNLVQGKQEKPQAKQDHSRPRKTFSPETAAVLIQSMYRGYVVRRSDPLKYLREIAKVRSKSKGLQAQVCKQEDLERICSDTKERLKLTEGIMALLLQLDVIQGVHPVVREFRKSAARELIQLQETVDNVIKQLNKQQGSLKAKSEDVTSDDNQTLGTSTVQIIASEKEAGDVETVDQSILATKADKENCVDDHKSRVSKDSEKVATSDENVEEIVEVDKPIPSAGENEGEGLKIMDTSAQAKDLECSETCKDADNQVYATSADNKVELANALADDYAESNQLGRDSEREDIVLSAQPTNDETLDRSELPEGVPTSIEEMASQTFNDDTRSLPSCDKEGESVVCTNHGEADYGIEHNLMNEAEIPENVMQAPVHLLRHQGTVPTEQPNLEICNSPEEQEKIDHDAILLQQSPSKETVNIFEDGLAHQLAVGRGEYELVIADDESSVGVTATDIVEGGEGLSQISVPEVVSHHITDSVIASEMKDADQAVKDGNDHHETEHNSSEEVIQNVVGVIEGERPVEIIDQSSVSCGSSSIEDAESMGSAGGTFSIETDLDALPENSSVEPMHSTGESDSISTAAKDWNILENLKANDSPQSVSNEAMPSSAAMEDNICVAQVHEIAESTGGESTHESASFEQDLSNLHVSTVASEVERINAENAFSLFKKPLLPEDEESKMQNAEDKEKNLHQHEMLDVCCNNLTSIAKDCKEKVDNAREADGFQETGSEMGNTFKVSHNRDYNHHADTTLPDLDCKCNIAEEDVKNICYTDNRVNYGTALLATPADSAPIRNATVATKIDDTTGVNNFEANVSEVGSPNKPDPSTLQLMQVLSEENKMLKSLVNEIMHCSRIQTLSILHLQERLLRLEGSLSLRKPKKSSSKSKGNSSKRK